jgi:hypothetical protein
VIATGNSAKKQDLQGMRRNIVGVLDRVEGFSSWRRTIAMHESRTKADAYRDVFSVRWC